MSKIQDQSKQKLVQIIANIITTNLLSLATKKNQNLADLFKPEDILFLAKLFQNNEISNVGLQEAIEYLAENKESDAQTVVQKLNLLQISDLQVLEKFVQQAIINNPKQVEQYLAGKKTQILGFLVGYCMKISQGKGNPKLFNQILERELSKLENLDLDKN